MIAEVSAVIGALNAVNGAINTIRETKGNVQSLSKVFQRVNSAAEGIATIEGQVSSGKRSLSSKEAMDLAFAKRQQREHERQLKDLFLIAGEMKTYEDMKRIQAKSVANAKKAAATASKRKAARAAELKQAASIIFIAAGVFLLFGMGLFLYIQMR